MKTNRQSVNWKKKYLAKLRQLIYAMVSTPTMKKEGQSSWLKTKQEKEQFSTTEV